MREEGKGQAMVKNTVCLWYDKDAEAAARFYAETFASAASRASSGAAGRADARNLLHLGSDGLSILFRHVRDFGRFV
jgi:hypothetical protein